MRFTITPLGSAGGRGVGQVVDDIVRYLEPRTPDTPTHSPIVPSGAGPASYYADRGSEPGRWLGDGAKKAQLHGKVDSADFAGVLAGRDPRTGARLITAQGSAGRRPTLGAGNRTRFAHDGTPLYDARDAAAALDCSIRETDALLAAGQRVAVASFLAVVTRTHPPGDPAGSFLVPRIDEHGVQWVDQHELGRCARARERGITPAEVSAAGAPADQLSLTEAARLTGLTTRYLRGLCRHYDDHRADITRTLEDGHPPRRAYLVAYRGTKGQWLIKREDLAAYLERRVAPAVRVGYDLTLTTEKSLGVLALLGGDTVRGAVLDAIEAGNDLGLAHLEQHAAAARRKGEGVPVQGWTVASFRHLTSRALDPFPHHHNVVANTVVDEHGDRRALDARGLYWHAQEASALATAEMRYQLTAKLGVRWRPGRSGGWEIDGIPDAVVREFSRRRNDIDDAIAELEAAIGRHSNLRDVQAIVTGTRPRKADVDPAQLVEGWWLRAQQHGLTPRTLQRCVGAEHPALDEGLDIEAVCAQLASPKTGLCANTSIFTRVDVLAALVDLPVPGRNGGVQPLLMPAAELAVLADQFLASRHVIELHPQNLPTTSRLARQPIFTTPEILGVQRRILEARNAGVNTSAARAQMSHISQALDASPQLTDEQRTLVSSFCGSGDRVQCAIGRAGAGKTTTMRTAAAAWTTAGFRVIGTAVKGEAARHLATGAGIPTETVAWYLARRDSPSPPLDARTVLIVDEASTLSDRDLDALIAMCNKHGTALRLVGDPDQHGAVAAGGMFRVLCETRPERTPELRTMHRVTNPADRAAAVALREGRIDEALRRLDDAGHLTVADNDIDLYIGMLSRWWDAHTRGDHHPMVDRRHRTRRQLNRLARQLLRTNGQLGDQELSATGDRAFAAGDRVIARAAARHLHPTGRPDGYVRNGAVGTVERVTRGRTPEYDALRVTFDGIGVVEVPRSFIDEHIGAHGRREVGLDHAYAVTSYAIQGATYDTSTSRIDEDASRAETYVDLTRGRHTNHIFLTRSVDPLDGEHLPRVPPAPIEEAAARALTASGPERTAIEIDPDAGALRPEARARVATQARTPKPTAARLSPARR